jgi:hypothetical protein
LGKQKDDSCDKEDLPIELDFVDCYFTPVEVLYIGVFHLFFSAVAKEVLVYYLYYFHCCYLKIELNLIEINKISMAVGIFEDIDDNVFPIIPQLAKKI